MRLATLALVASSCFVGSPAEAHRSAPPPRQLRGIAVLKEAFHLERQRSLRVGHLQGPGGAVVDGLLVGVLAKVGWMVPTVAPGLILTALPLLTPTSSYLGWQDGDIRRPRRFLGGLFRLTTNLGVGLTVGTFAAVNTAWNGLDWLRGLPTTSMIDRFNMRARAFEMPAPEPPSSNAPSAEPIRARF